ncbi:MAG: SCO family protein, partial [Burkholderiales bacterium]
MNRRHVLNRLTLATALAAGSLLIGACSEDKPSFKAIDLTGADYAKDFSLTDQDGQQRSLKDYRG